MIDHPFVSIDENVFRIIDVKKCTKKYLFHSSGEYFDVLDPKYNSIHTALGGKFEYGLPVVFASNEPSNAFCYRPTSKYLETKERAGTSVYHRLTKDNHRILLGSKLKGFIYVLDGADFYEVLREDFEVGKWVRSTEWISEKQIKPIDIIEVTEPYDWEMVPEYEFLGLEYVGEMSVDKYISHATDPNVIKVLGQITSKEFVPTIPDGLEKYL
jgi:hypothetical protein